MERSTGRRPAALDPDPIPEAALPAWQLWLDLHQGRSSGGWGPTSLSWADMDAWARMRGVKPTWSELELIRTIDRAFILSTAKPKETEQ